MVLFHIPHGGTIEVFDEGTVILTDEDGDTVAFTDYEWRSMFYAVAPYFLDDDDVSPSH
jgi:hypothetical protein